MKQSIIKELFIGEVSFVDKPAQEGAQTLIIKRVGTLDDEPGEPTAKGMFLDELAQWDTLDPIRGVLSDLYDNHHALQNAIKAAFTYSTIKNKKSAIKQIVKEFVEALEGISDSVVSQIQLNKRGEEMSTDEIKKMVADSLSSLFKSGDKAGGDNPTDEQVAKAVKEITDAVTAKSDVTDKIGKMKSEHQAYLAKIAEDKDITEDARKQKTDFFLSDGIDDSQRDMLTKAAGIESKPIEEASFTDATGQVFKRADLGAAYDSTVALAKKNDELTKRLSDVVTEQADRQTVQKIRDEYPNIPGSDAEKLAMFKSVNAIEDEALRAGALKALKSCDAGMGNIFRTQSNGSPSAAAGADAVGKLAESIVKSHAEKGESISYEKAYEMALNSPEGDLEYEKRQDEMADSRGTSAH